MKILVAGTWPAFFRAARGHKLSDTELQTLAADIKSLHTRGEKGCGRKKLRPV
jgi:hypothetical protein